MVIPVRVLIVEDSEDDAALLLRELRRSGFDPTCQRVDTPETMQAALDGNQWDVVISDHSLPRFNALAALRVLQAHGLDLPFIIVSGTMDDDSAVEAMRAGAHDFFLKGKLKRLGPAIERELREATVREERRQVAVTYRMLVENSLQGFCILQDRKLVFASPPAFHSDKYSASELMAMTPAQLAAAVFPDDRELVYGCLRDCLTGARQMARFQVRLRGKAGRLRWDEVLAVPITYRGKPAIQLTFLDITERKQTEESERAQRAMAEALRDTAAALASTLTFDEVLDRILVEISRVMPHDAARIMLLNGDIVETVRSRGYEKRAPAAVGTSLRLAIATTANVRTIVESDRPLAILDTRTYAGWVDSPITRWVRSNASAPIHFKGRMIGLLGVDSATPGFYDMADAERLQAFADQAGVAIENARLVDQIRDHAAALEQRVAERTAELLEREASLKAASEREAAHVEALSAANARLQELDLLKSQFVSNVSHELRTPLTNIKLYLSLLEQGKPEKREQYLATLHREADLLQALIEDLLIISRMDLGKSQPLLQPVDINGLAGRLAGDRVALLAVHGLTLQTSLAPDLPPALADSRMLSQVLTNLLTNAMNYTPSGGKVAVSTGLQRAGDQAWITIMVSDTGCGIAPGEQSRIFDRFYRGEAGRKSGAPGTGLGLSICHEILQRHGGHITVTSQVGEGSTFTVWLPAAESPVWSER